MTETVKLLTCNRCGERVELGLDETGDFFERNPQGWTTVAYDCKTKDLTSALQRPSMILRQNHSTFKIHE